ncbi:hypothetical protein TIFTF001_020530 [Ficus carica]|uniref:Retrotransposon gag domain-containing protein n=1 Tax=Ficus carica TaxID=3494 RepID=A0AA88DCP1_FICCA|nr:hypothetical protein TIFTF001_020530 [Ficus carica]
MAPSKAKKMKMILEGDSHETNISMSEHNTKTNDNVKLTLPDLVKGYESPNFVHFDGRKGNAKEHISWFLDALGQHARDKSLRHREFSKSLTGKAYTWYTTLTPGTIHTWEEMVGEFCQKYFQNEEKITTLTISNTRQNQGENLVDYGVLGEHRNQAILKVDRSARRTTLLVKITSEARGWRGERKETLHSLEISVRPPRPPYHRRQEKETQPPIPCTDEEFHTILNQWIQDRVVCLFPPRRQPIGEDKKHPKYCHLHQFIHHPTTECQVLHKIFLAKINNGTLELPTKKQTTDLDPLPRHEGKETCAMAGHVSKDKEMIDVGEDLSTQKTDPKPSEALWETSRGND